MTLLTHLEGKSIDCYLSVSLYKKQNNFFLSTDELFLKRELQKTYDSISKSSSYNLGAWMYEFWWESSGRFSRLQKSSLRGTEEFPNFQQNHEKSVSLKILCWERGLARKESWLWPREWVGNCGLLLTRCSCCTCNIPSPAPFWVTVLQLLQSCTESVRYRTRHFSARCRLSSLIHSHCAVLTYFYLAAGIQELNSYILSA